jgi:hypothetical protein
MYSSVRQKAGKYKHIAGKHELPFVVFVYSWFSACVQVHEVEACLFPADGIFPEYPALTGVCHFDEQGGGYRFTYYRNPIADRPNLRLCDDFLPYFLPIEPAGQTSKLETEGEKSKPRV